MIEINVVVGQSTHERAEELSPNLASVPAADTDQSIIQDKAAKNLLKFTCPKCRSHRLEAVVLMRQEIEGVYDSHGPDYDWHHDPDTMVVIARAAYASPSDGNFYRCYDCEAPLTDEEGNEFWEAERLYKWLKGLPVANQDQEDEGAESSS